MNACLTALEFVFTTLAVNYSPNGCGGYQIVYASPGLSPPDRDAIKERVGFYEGSAGDKPRWQFFSLPSGSSAVAVIQPIPPDGELSDQRGGYLAYALAVTAAEFAAAAGSDPFRLLDAVMPPATAREVVDGYGAGSQPAPHREIPLAAPRAAAGSWAGSDLRALLALTLGAGSLAAGGRAVIFHGPPAARMEALRLALQLAPKSVRAACTFDSEGSDHLARTSGLWAVGLDGPLREAHMHPLVDAANRQVGGDIPSIGTHSMGALYGRWFDRAVGSEADPRNFQPTLAGIVETLAAAIESDAALPTEIELTPALCAELCEIWSAELLAAVRRRLVAATSPTLAEEFAPAICAELNAPEFLALAIGAGLDADRLAPLFAHALLEKPRKLRGDDWRQLAKIAEEGFCAPLAVLVSVLSGEKDDAARRRAALARLTNDEFDTFLALCPVPVSPTRLLDDVHVSALIIWAAGRTLPDKVLTALIEETLAFGAGKELAPLTERVLRMSARAQAQLDRTLAALPQAACPFRARLREQVADRKSRCPWWRRLLPGGKRTGAPGARDSHKRGPS